MKSKIIFIRKLALVILLLLLLTVLAVNLNKPLPETIPQPMVKLYLHQSGQIIELEIEEYVAGVVAAEMPASFELEALKAQAVCARTYACKKILDGKPYPLNADLSDDISSCQAYVSWDKFPIIFVPVHPLPAYTLFWPSNQVVIPVKLHRLMQKIGNKVMVASFSAQVLFR
jgi:hypothetical protein